MPLVPALLLVAVVQLVFGSGAASAATYTVDTVADEADAVPAGACAAASGKCTLRAAIELANAVPGRDRIGFDETLFDGELADTIELVGELPAIADPLAIVNRCPPNQYNDIPRRPCAGLEAAAAFGFRVEADEVAIEGIAVTGAAVGVGVLASSDDFVARRNWIGADLELGPGGNGTGILLGPGANDAGIGVYVSGVDGGNLIVNNSEVGLDLEGASRAEIVNNGFGVLNGEAAPNGTNIEITDAVAPTPVKAVQNQIGNEAFHGLGDPLSDCSESCNEISGAIEDGIDLNGDGADELPATGPTVIKGNFIGTEFSGRTAVPNGHAGIVVGEADQVTIGGPEGAEGNRISGGLWAVLAGPQARELTIASNVVGRHSSGYGLLDPPSQGAFSIDSGDIDYPEGRAEVIGNRILLEEGVAISSKAGAALIADNRIYGGDLGIHAFGSSPGWYGAIVGNSLEFTGAQGILVESSKFRILANEIYLPEEAGIAVASGAPPRVGAVEIGGDEEELENTIEWSAGAAIAVLDGETEFVEVGRNHGAHNAGPFIDLGGDGPGNQPTGPNQGVQPPTIDFADVHGASGMASPSGAFVRVFAKSEDSPGEVERFLASTVVGEGGRWSVTYPEPLPDGTPIAVSQTAFGGTSELALGSTVAPPPPEVVCASPLPGVAGGCLGPPCLAAGDGCRATPLRPAPLDPAPLVARIVSGPEGRSVRRTATFRFAASAPGSKFKCKLDKKAFANCKSPKTYKKLKPGKHVFKVKATDAAGNASAVLTRRFTMLPT